MVEGSAMVRASLLMVLLTAWPLTSPPSIAGASLGCGVVPLNCEEWVAIHQGTDDWSPDVVASADGSRAYLVTRSRSTGEQAITVHSHDGENGALLWSSTYAPRNFPTFRMATLSPDGTRLHVVGHGGVLNTNLWQAFVLTFDTHDGTILWTAKWDIDTEGHAVTVSPDGSRVYATGVQAGHNFVTVALDAATGQKVWQASYNNGGGHSGDWRSVSSDIPYGIGADGDRVYVTGTSASSSGLLEATTVAYHAGTGAHAWTRRTHAVDATGAAAATEGYEVVPQGLVVYVLGTHGLEAYETSSGALIWSQPALACRAYWAMHSPGDCVLLTRPDNQLVFAGTHHAVAAFRTSQGEEVWRMPLRAGAARLPLDAGDHRLGMTGDMAIAPDGRHLYVATPGGRDRYVTDTASSINANIETLAIDSSTGRVLWRAVYDRAWESVASVDAAASRVFISGESSYAQPSDAAVIAYDPTEFTSV